MGEENGTEAAFRGNDTEENPREERLPAIISKFNFLAAFNGTKTFDLINFIVHDYSTTRSVSDDKGRINKQDSFIHSVPLAMLFILIRFPISF